MTLDELYSEIAEAEAPQVVIDKTVHLTPHREVKATLCFPSTRPQEAHPSRLLPGGTVVVVEVDGHIEYKVRYPDGHIGAIED